MAIFPWVHVEVFEIEKRLIATSVSVERIGVQLIGRSRLIDIGPVATKAFHHVPGSPSSE